jgi:hypothetical protein
MSAAGWDPNLGGQVAFGGFERRDLPSPEERQRFFVEMKICIANCRRRA